MGYFITLKKEDIFLAATVIAQLANNIFKAIFNSRKVGGRAVIRFAYKDTKIFF